MIWNTNEILMVIFVLGVFLIATEAGYRFGRRRHAEADEGDKTHISALQAALLGLLAFMVGFTFAMSVGRFDTRKGLAIQESNAISATYLRAQLLPELERPQIFRLLHTYVDAWRVSHDADADAASIDAAIVATVDLQQQLWTAAGALAEKTEHSPPTGLFMSALDQMIDLHEKRLSALENHVPQILFWLVCIIAIVSFGFVGYRSGLDGRRRFRSTASLALVVTLVLAVILDLDRPGHGFIRIDGRSLVAIKQRIDALDNVAATTK
jgi:hypothetical protein